MLALSLFGCAEGEKELNQNEIVSKLRPSVFKISAYSSDGVNIKESQGSGFFIDSKGTFITNLHVIENSYEIKAYINNTKIDVDEVKIKSDESSDYAICQLKGYISTPVTFSDSYNENDKIYALGYPLDSSSLVTTSGTIVGEAVSYDGIQYIENTALIHHGSSGGALANEDGEIIGITTCEFDDGNFGAIPYSSFKNAISQIENPENNNSNEKKYWVTRSDFDKLFYVYDDFKEQNSFMSHFYIYLEPKFTDLQISIDFSLFVSFDVTFYFTTLNKSSNKVSTYQKSCSAYGNIYRSQIEFNQSIKIRVQSNYFGPSPSYIYDVLSTQANYSLDSFSGMITIHN